MSNNPSSNNSIGSSSSLRPAWYRGAGNQGGRGFQPPPTVTSDSRGDNRGRSSSISSGTGPIGSGEPKRDANKFSALQDGDDDFIVVGGSSGAGGGGSAGAGPGGGGNGNSKNDSDQPKNSRSEAFRSSFGSRAGSAGRSTGRSLADLAARVPETATRTVSGGYAGPSRFSSLRTTSSGAPDAIPPALGTGSAHAPITTTGSGGSAETAYKSDAKVIRFTRERLLSMRPQPKPVPEGADPVPPHLRGFIGTVILSTVPQEPVCWDTLDAEEIWAQATRDRRGIAAQKPGVPLRGLEPTVGGRGIAAPPGRWQRGVALPPPDENLTSKRGKERDSTNPNDLWDDPVGGTASAANDFSAFGLIPDDPKTATEAFDFERMAEASKKFEEELHGSKGSNEFESDSDANAAANAHLVKVDPKRPLATVGTAIKSGSGDDVNVFEDFDTPSESEDVGEPMTAATSTTTTTTITSAGAEAIKAGDEDPTASSRLMKMIGVGQDVPTKGDGSESKDISPWGLSVSEHESATLGGVPQSAESIAVGASSIPLNPWGDPIISSVTGGDPIISTGDPIMPTGDPNDQIRGMDLAARLEAFATEQKIREAAELEQKELMHRKQLQEQEEAQRHAMAQQQQQQSQAHQQQQAALQQAANVQAQIELVLMERISAILENSWGRADLVSILASLHAEDSRVIPLLGTVDLLRDLLAHNPRRIALRHDPSFGTEMAVLLMTNAQWQQQQQQQRQQEEAQARAQQEELRRREQLEQQRRLEEDMQRQLRIQSQDKAMRINPDAPWFYSDPQGNIQGPFRGDEMRQWLEAGYFKGDLPISQQNTGPFIALSVIFPDLSVAFKGFDQDSAAAEEEEAKARAAAEEEQRRAQQQWEQERIAAEKQAEAREAEKRELERQRERELELERMRQQEAAAAAQAQAAAAARAEAEAAAAAAAAAAAPSSSSSKANGNNESSAQLKMMLGLSSEHVEENKRKETQKQDEVSTAPAVEKSEKRSNKSGNKNKRAANKDANASANAKAESNANANASASATAWGGAAKNPPTNKKSMSEIQKEEARAAAILAMQKETLQPRQSSSGWANIAAAGGSSGWSSGTLKPGIASAAAVVAGGGPTPAAPVSRGAIPGQASAANKSTQPGSTAGASRGKPSGVTQQARNSSSASTTAAEEFGASMSPALEKWCKDQMQKLKSTDDLTLVSFCMTLNDPVEIRQYLTTYLGSTPQVNNFATEFINKIGCGGPAKTKQEEWETPGSAKKGRKKKGSS